MSMSNVDPGARGSGVNQTNTQTDNASVTNKSENANVNGKKFSAHDKAPLVTPKKPKGFFSSTFVKIGFMKDPDIRRQSQYRECVSQLMQMKPGMSEKGALSVIKNRVKTHQLEGGSESKALAKVKEGLNEEVASTRDFISEFSDNNDFNKLVDFMCAQDKNLKRGMAEFIVADANLRAGEVDDPFVGQGNFSDMTVEMDIHEDVMDRLWTQYSDGDDGYEQPKKIEPRFSEFLKDTKNMYHPDDESVDETPQVSQRDMTQKHARPRKRPLPDWVGTERLSLHSSGGLFDASQKRQSAPEPIIPPRPLPTVPTGAARPLPATPIAPPRPLPAVPTGAARNNDTSRLGLADYFEAEVAKIKDNNDDLFEAFPPDTTGVNF